MPTAETVLNRKGGSVVTVQRQCTVLEAAKIMNEKRIGAVIVVEGETASGIFTERDVLTRIVAKQEDPAKILVGDVMTTPMACCTRATKLAECKTVMTEKKIRHLPVVEGGTLYGMISSGDVLAHEVASQENTIRYLNDYLYGRS